MKRRIYRIGPAETEDRERRLHVRLLKEARHRSTTVAYRKMLETSAEFRAGVGKLGGTFAELGKSFASAYEDTVSALSAQSIRRLSTEGWLDKDGERRYLIQPFHERTRLNGKTFGLGPAGYDIRFAKSMWLWPLWGRKSFAIEKFDIPLDVTCMIMDKSSWARKFVAHLNTNGEPGWRGWLTLEAVRFLPWPVFLREGDPAVNIIFLWLDEETDQPYEGKYMDQPYMVVPSLYDGESYVRRKYAQIRGWWRRKDHPPGPVAPSGSDGEHGPNVHGSDAPS